MYMSKVNIYEKFSDSKVAENVKKVSVIVPNYNYAAFLNERIDSIIHQTYPVYELIMEESRNDSQGISTPCA